MSDERKQFIEWLNTKFRGGTPSQIVVEWMWSAYEAGHPPTGDAAGKDSVDAARLNAIADESWDLRCFTIPYEDDADIGWRVIQHHMQAPHERVVAEVFNDDPRAAIDAAIASLTKTADGEIKS